MEYSEFRIIVKDASRRDCRLSAEIPAIPFDLTYDPFFVSLYEEIIQLFIKWLKDNNDKTRAQEDVKIFGTLLFRVIFNPALELQFRKAYKNIRANPGKKLRVILEFDQNARNLAVWPWEYIYLPDHESEGRGFFLAAEEKIVLTRQVPLTFEKFEKSNKINILIIKSIPTKTDYEGEEDPRLIVSDDIVKKIEHFKEWNTGTEKRNKITINVDVLENPTKASFKKMIDVNYQDGKKYHIVHFIGHGKYVPSNQREKEGGYLGFIKPDKPDYISWLSDGAFAECFNNKEPRLIFLNACEGAMSQSYESFRGMALQLVFSRIPAVIAMQYPVTNKVAIKFANKFYDSLLEGKDIDEAVQDGRLEIGWYSDEAENFTNRDFGSPVVYLQKEDGLIIASGDEIAPPAKEKLTCPNCRNEVLTDQRFCGHCGNPLMPCPNKECGKPFSLKLGLCIWCGYKTAEESSLIKESTSAERRGPVSSQDDSTWEKQGGKLPARPLKN